MLYNLWFVLWAGCFFGMFLPEAMVGTDADRWAAPVLAVSAMGFISPLVLVLLGVI